MKLLQMETAWTPEKLVPYHITRLHNPEDIDVYEDPHYETFSSLLLLPLSLITLFSNTLNLYSSCRLYICVCVCVLYVCG